MIVESRYPLHPVKRTLASALAAGVLLGISVDAGAALTLTATGIADGFSVSTFIPIGAYYGLIGAVSAPWGFAIGSGYARGQLPIDSTSTVNHSAALTTASAGGTPTAIASLGAGHVGLLGGRLLPGRPNHPRPGGHRRRVNAFYGLWGNGVTGHLAARARVCSTSTRSTATSSLWVNRAATSTASPFHPDGSIAYVETNSNALYGWHPDAGPERPSLRTGLPGGPDGTGVISGGMFDGDIIANNNDGTVS